MKNVCKKILVSTMAVATLFSLCACGQESNELSNDTINTAIQDDVSLDIVPDEAVDTVVQEDAIEYLQEFTAPGAYEVSIDGKVISLPCPISTLTDLGFDFLNDSGSQELEYDEVTYATLVRGEESMVINVHNKNEDTLRYDEAMVIGLTVDETLTSAKLYGGINLASTEEEVIAVFGEDYQLKESGNIRRLDYNTGFYQYIAFSFTDDQAIAIAVYGGLNY